MVRRSRTRRSCGWPDPRRRAARVPWVPAGGEGHAGGTFEPPDGGQPCEGRGPNRRRFGIDHLVADPQFRSPAEFREVMDRVFTMMSGDSDIGPRLREADVPQRFEFPDLDMVVNVRAAVEGEDGSLHWAWTDDVDWKPKVRMRMDSATCNRYFQGRENVAMAIARR